MYIPTRAEQDRLNAAFQEVSLMPGESPGFSPNGFPQCRAQPNSFLEWAAMIGADFNGREGVEEMLTALGIPFKEDDVTGDLILVSEKR